jgi:PBP1b-binding outer membrane lipoprotein LpoB
MVSKWTEKIAGSIKLIIMNCSMKKVGILVLLWSVFAAFLSGCASSGPSPEEQVREQDRQREAERQQADFRKSLPPVANPGQGQ